MQGLGARHPCRRPPFSLGTRPGAQPGPALGELCTSSPTRKVPVSSKQPRGVGTHSERRRGASHLLCVQSAPPFTSCPNCFPTPECYPFLYLAFWGHPGGRRSKPFAERVLGSPVPQRIQIEIRAEECGGQGESPAGQCSTIPTCFSATPAASPPSGKGRAVLAGRGTQGPQPDAPPLNPSPPSPPPGWQRPAAAGW